MAASLFARLLAPVGPAMKGLGTAAQYATVGGKYKDVIKAAKRPIRKGGIDNPATRKNLERLGFAGTGLGFLAGFPLVSGIRTDIYGSPEEDPRVMEEERLFRREAAQRRLDAISNQRRELELKNKEQRLQQIAPDLYNRIAAGRYLPAGAVVIGGAPRRDLLREFSEAMHEGAFAAPPTNVDISDLLA